MDVRGSLENFFGCCGLDSFNDSFANWAQCPNFGVNVTTGPACGDILANEFYTQFNTVGTCGIVFAVLMSLCIAFVCCLIRGIQRKNMKSDVGGLHPGDDSANPSTLHDPNSPGAVASAAATGGVPGSTGVPPPVSTV